MTATGAARLRTRAKEAARRVLETPAYATGLRLHDQLAARTARTQGSADRVLFVAPGGEGNIGDQSMYEAVMRQVSGPVDVIMLSEGALDVPPADEHRTTVHVLPHLIRGHIGQRVPDVRRYRELLASASKVLIPGADTIDGGHPHTSVTRLNLAHLALDAGVPVSVQGFSWSASAPASVTASARRLVARGARLHPRDPASHRRLTASGVSTDLAADLVFAGIDLVDLPAGLDAALQAIASSGRRYVLLNTSGLIHRKVDLMDEYASLVSQLHARDLSVIFVPHVLREPDNDLILARRLHQQYGAEGDVLVDRQLAPGQVQVLARGALCVITGRMHLAIHALSGHTPAITLSTVGKVEGLLEMFDRPQWCVLPRPGLTTTIMPLVDAIRAGEDDERAAIGAALPEIRRRAELNFS